MRMADYGAGKHMSPLHSGQEDKRGRKGGIGIWREREKEKKKEGGGGGGGFKEKKEKKVDCFLDERGSTVVHEQENRDSFFGPWTDKSTHQSRSQDWKLKTYHLCLPSSQTWDSLYIQVEILVHCHFYLLLFLYWIPSYLWADLHTQPEPYLNKVSQHLT